MLFAARQSNCYRRVARLKFFGKDQVTILSTNGLTDMASIVSREVPEKRYLRYW